MMRVQPEIIADAFRAEVGRRLAEREAVLQAMSDEEGCGATMAAFKVAVFWPAVERVKATADAVCTAYLEMRRHSLPEFIVSDEMRCAAAAYMGAEKLE